MIVAIISRCPMWVRAAACQLQAQISSCAVIGATPCFCRKPGLTGEHTRTWDRPNFWQYLQHLRSRRKYGMLHWWRDVVWHPKRSHEISRATLLELLGMH